MAEHATIERLESQLHDALQRIRSLEEWAHNFYEYHRAEVAQTAAAPAFSQRQGQQTAAPAPVEQASPPPAREPASAAIRERQPKDAALRSGRPNVNLEDLVGGRLLAWLGGAAIVLGLAFFFALAVSHGWIGQLERTLLVAAGSLALIGLGAWLHERKGRTDAAVAAASAGIAGLFLTVVVAAQVYQLIPASLGVAFALATGALGTALALRWEAKLVGALGIIGALLSPVLAGAPSDGTTVALLFVATLSAAAVLLWQRWDWLALGAFVVSAPQWLYWTLDRASLMGAIAALVAFGCLNVALSVGFELRRAEPKLRISGAFLLGLNALVLAAGGWYALKHLGGEFGADLWLIGLAFLHLAVGAFGDRLRRVSHELALLALVLGVVLAEIAFASIVSGPALALGFAAAGAGFAALLRRLRPGSVDENLATIGLGGNVAISLGRALVEDAPAGVVSAGIEPGAALVLAGVAASCLVSARLAGAGRRMLRVALDVLGLAVVAYLTAAALDGAALVIAWALEACALAQVARRGGDKFALYGACAFLAGALVHAIAFEAQPGGLVWGFEDVREAALALAACALAALRMAQLRLGDEDLRRALAATAALVLLYLASGAIVTAYQPGDGAIDSTLLELGVRQQGQLLMSTLWALVGLVALLVGLTRELRDVRIGALALLLATVAKVFLFDLAALTAGYRVASFVGLGLLLLAGSFAWQRFRPKPQPDLREVPKALR